MLIKLAVMRALGQICGYQVYAINESPEGKILDVFIPAGFPSPAQDYMENDISLADLFNLDSPAVYILRAVGDSMIEAKIFSNNLIVVDRGISPCHNDIVVATLNGEFTIKRLLSNTSSRKPDI